MTKASQIFEGENSSLRKTFDDAVSPHQEENTINGGTCNKCGQENVTITGVSTEFLHKCHFESSLHLAEQKGRENLREQIEKIDISKMTYGAFRRKVIKLLK
jgi:hypothetical protein